MDEASLHNPHDAFIKVGLGKPRQMAAFLQAYLPPPLTAAVDWSSLQPMDKAFKTGFRALSDLENAPDHLTFLRICLTYLTRAGNTLDRKTLYTIIQEEKSARLKDEAMTIAEQLIQEGRQEGERILLRRQMTRKFGDLSSQASHRLGCGGASLRDYAG